MRELADYDCDCKKGECKGLTDGSCTDFNVCSQRVIDECERLGDDRGSRTLTHIIILVFSVLAVLSFFSYLVIEKKRMESSNCDVSSIVWNSMKAHGIDCSELKTLRKAEDE